MTDEAISPLRRRDLRLDADRLLEIALDRLRLLHPLPHAALYARANDMRRAAH